MDLSIIIGDWPYDEDEEANNVRKVVGVDGAMKVQVRMRSGLVQWEVEGRPDGTHPHGFPSVLDYCYDRISRGPNAEPPDIRSPRSDADLEPDLVEELGEEIFDYYKRGQALFLLGDYRRALGDALHNLRVLRLIRLYADDTNAVVNYDRHRPGLLLDRSRAEMLLDLQAGDVRKALDALNRGIRDIEGFYTEYEMQEELGDSRERQILVDLRRSLREKHNVPLNDEELLHSLRVEQEIAIRRENYEMAARLRDKIKALQHRGGPAA
jgi:tetratricopeptide (TPR) repeat protein